jgi:chromosome segregation ATPase
MHTAQQLEEQVLQLTFAGERIEALAKMVDERDQRIAERNAELEENRRTTNYYRDACIKQEEEVAARRAELSDLFARYERRCTELDAAKVRIAELEQQIEANVDALRHAQRNEARLEAAVACAETAEADRDTALDTLTSWRRLLGDPEAWKARAEKAEAELVRRVPGSVEGLTEAARLIFGVLPKLEHLHAVARWEAVLQLEGRGYATMGDDAVGALAGVISCAIRAEMWR